MDDTWIDIKHAVRILLKRPGFTAASVVALALGIGANTAIFSVVHSVVMRPLAYPQPEELAMIWETDRSKGLDHDLISPLNFIDYRALGHVFQDVAVWWYPQVNLTDALNEPIRANTIEVSGNFFAVMGVQPILGRAFSYGDTLHGNESEIVLSYRLWQGRYGGDASIIGRAVQLEGTPFTVVGIMPPGFLFPGETDVWQWLGWNLGNHYRGAYFMEAVARMNPGLQVAQAQAEMDALMTRLSAEYPDTNKTRGARVVALHHEVVGFFRPALFVLLSAVGFLLLLACANVSNLLLSRASSREREVAVRAAIGAGRGRLIRQFLTESLILALLGTAAGCALAYLAVRWLVVSNPIGIPRLEGLSLDPTVLGFTAGVALLTALLFGWVPAVHLSRRDVQQALQSGGRSQGGYSSRRRAQSMLVVAEVALSVVLLVGAGLLIRSFIRLVAQHPGFNPSRVVTLNVQLPTSTHRDWTRVGLFFDEVLHRVKEDPAVQAAGGTGFLPLESAWRIDFFLPHRPPFEPGMQPKAQHCTVTPGYFETLSVPLLQGRFFQQHDGTDKPGVVIINEELSRRYWPTGNPIGDVIKTRVTQIGPLGRNLIGNQEFEIVGVVGDVKNNSLITATDPAIFFSSLQFPYRNMNLVIRGQATQAQLVDIVRREIRRLDPLLAISQIQSMAELLDKSVSQPRFLTLLMSAFAGLALLLTAVGIYGVLSYAVTQQRQEIGIRMALGAAPSRVRRLVVWRGLALTGLGILLGVVGAYWLSRLLSSLLFEIGFTDPSTYGGVVLLILVVAWLACYLPARRASRIDPLSALRVE